jgi:hypothetical protein
LQKEQKQFQKKEYALEAKRDTKNIKKRLLTGKQSHAYKILY